MRADRHFRQLVALFEQLVPTGIGQRHLFDTFAVFFRFLQRVVLFPQFGGNHLHLLPQIVVPLVLIHLLPHPVMDGLLQFEHRHLAIHQTQQRLGTGMDIGLLQQLLLLFGAQFHLERDVIGQHAHILHSLHHARGVRRALRGGGVLRILLEVADELACQRHCFHRVAHAGFPILANARHAHILLHLHLLDVRAVHALCQNADIVARQPQHLTHLGDHTVVVQIVARGIFHLGVALRHQEDGLVMGQRLVERRNGAGATHIQMQHDFGKSHHSAQGQQR